MLTALLVLSVVFFSLSSVMFWFRMLNPQLLRNWRSFGEQVLITVAYMLLVGVFVVSILVCASGVEFGKFPTKLYRRKLLYVLEVLLQAQTLVTTLSIAATLQSFSRASRTGSYVYFLRVLFIFQCLYMAVLVPIVAPCKPISKCWTGDPMTETKYISYTTLHISIYSIRLVDDLFLVLAPVPIVYHLHPRQARMAGIFIFILGAAVLGTDISQLVYISTVRRNAHKLSLDDISDIVLRDGIRSMIRMYIAFLAACAPQARVTVASWYRKAMEARQTSGIEGVSEGTMFVQPMPLREEKSLPSCSSKVVEDVQGPSSVSGNMVEHFEEAFKGGEIILCDREGLQNQDLVSLRVMKNEWLQSSKAVFQMAGSEEPPREVSTAHQNEAENWENMYPSESVTIRPFEDQFSVLPFSFGGSPTGDSAWSEKTPDLTEEVVGRSTLQKEYFDRVFSTRGKQNAISIAGSSPICLPRADSCTLPFHEHQVLSTEGS